MFKNMFNMGLNNDVVKYCGSGIPRNWAMSFEKLIWRVKELSYNFLRKLTSKAGTN